MRNMNDFSFIRQQAGMAALQELRNAGFPIDYIIANPVHTIELMDTYIMSMGVDLPVIEHEVLDD